MYYPLNVGRNMDEILRVLYGLQVADKYKVALPLDWKKGEKVIVPPPTNLAQMQERVDLVSEDKMDFYLVKKDL
jgi:peroxiredoxin (alkyl hydroperoxide reductase subunit C)